MGIEPLPIADAPIHRDGGHQLLDIGDARAVVQHQLNVGVQPVKLAQARDQPAGAKNGPYRQSHGLAVGRNMGLDLGPDVVKGPAHHPRQRAPRIGKEHLAGLADEQQAAPVQFQLPDLVAHAGGCHAQFFGRRLETEQAGCRLEGTQGGQGQALLRVFHGAQQCTDK